MLYSKQIRKKLCCRISVIQNMHAETPLPLTQLHHGVGSDSSEDSYNACSRPVHRHRRSLLLHEFRGHMPVSRVVGARMRGRGPRRMRVGRGCRVRRPSAD